MCNHIIKKGNLEYAIVEIEFYLFTNDHQDVITYPRVADAGRWFFHQSGVDLTFQSRDIEEDKDGNFTFEENASFGGILIRAIRPGNGEIIS